MMINNLPKTLLAGVGAAVVIGGTLLGAATASAVPVTTSGSEDTCGSTAPGSPVLHGAECNQIAVGGDGSLTVTFDSDGIVRDQSGAVVDDGFREADGVDGGFREVVTAQFWP